MVTVFEVDAVHVHHADVELEKQVGSSGSAVYPVLVPVVVSDSPPIEWASLNRSLSSCEEVTSAYVWGPLVIPVPVIRMVHRPVVGVATSTFSAVSIVLGPVRVDRLAGLASPGPVQG